MTVCNFFLQGRCRYGDKCWNEHPRDGRSGGGGGGYGSQHYRGSPSTPHRGGYGNRVWINPSQRSSGRDLEGPPSFSKEGNAWNRGGGGAKSFGFSSQDRDGGAKSFSFSSQDRDGGAKSFGFSSQDRDGGAKSFGFSSQDKDGGAKSFGFSSQDRDGGAKSFGFSSQDRDGGAKSFGFSSQDRDGGAKSFGFSSQDRDGGAKSFSFNSPDSLSSHSGDPKGFGFTSHNRFSALNSQDKIDLHAQDNQLEVVQKDMEIWASSGQWPLSCYGIQNVAISGFHEVSPEELRLEYINKKGDLQPYANSVQQLMSQWRSRVQDLISPSPATRSSLHSELNNPSHQSSGSFGKGFGAADTGASTSSFGFTTHSSGFGTLSTSQPVFGDPAPPSAASFSFSTPTNASTGLGGSAAGFSFSAGSGSGFTSSAANAFGQSSSAFGTSGPVGGSSSESSADKLFTPQNELSPEDLKEFSAKRFTLGQIPLKPPPLDMLVV